jgi:cell division protease FtsH
MSRLGRVAYRESHRSPFLASSMDERSSAHSEQTAREIDEEIRRIIDEAIGKVRHILEQRYDALIALTKRLIEIESVDAEELKRVVEENSRGPLVVPGTGSKVASLRPSLESGDSGAEKAV